MDPAQKFANEFQAHIDELTDKMLDAMARERFGNPEDGIKKSLNDIAGQWIRDRDSQLIDNFMKTPITAEQGEQMETGPTSNNSAGVTGSSNALNSGAGGLAASGTAGVLTARNESKTSRFDYVAYDQQATLSQNTFKAKVGDLEKEINELLSSPRAKALALTKLEEVYMWIGKAIRDDQIQRNGSAPLQEGRSNS